MQVAAVIDQQERKCRNEWFIYFIFIALNFIKYKTELIYLLTFWGWYCGWELWSNWLHYAWEVHSDWLK